PVDGRSGVIAGPGHGPARQHVAVSVLEGRRQLYRLSHQDIGRRRAYAHRGDGRRGTGHRDRGRIGQTARLTRGTKAKLAAAPVVVMSVVATTGGTRLDGACRGAPRDGDLR